VTVVNEAKEKLRIAVKLVVWTQEEDGRDVYKDSNELIYFPRQMDVEPEGWRLVRVGARTPAGVTERAYRLFLEEEPPASSAPGNSQIAFLFRFGVPVFLPPAVPKPAPEVMQPTLDKGKLSLVVKNTGNQHFRLNRLVISDGATYSQEITGWYSLAGSARTYTADVPQAVCRQARKLNILIEGEGIRLDRQLDVDPARCA
jgi:fimbrial chaperone protein